MKDEIENNYYYWSSRGWVWRTLMLCCMLMVMRSRADNDEDEKRMKNEECRLVPATHHWNRWQGCGQPPNSTDCDMENVPQYQQPRYSIENGWWLPKSTEIWRIDENHECLLQQPLNPTVNGCCPPYSLKNEYWCVLTSNPLRECSAVGHPILFQSMGLPHLSQCWPHAPSPLRENKGVVKYPTTPLWMDANNSQIPMGSVPFRILVVAAPKKEKVQEFCVTITSLSHGLWPPNSTQRNDGSQPPNSIASNGIDHSITILITMGPSRANHPIYSTATVSGCKPDTAETMGGVDHWHHPIPEWGMGVIDHTIPLLIMVKIRELVSTTQLCWHWPQRMGDAIVKDDVFVFVVICAGNWQHSGRCRC